MTLDKGIASQRSPEFASRMLVPPPNQILFNFSINYFCSGAAVSDVGVVVVSAILSVVPVDSRVR